MAVIQLWLIAAWSSSVWLRNCSHFWPSEGWLLPQIILYLVLILRAQLMWVSSVPGLYRPAPRGVLSGEGVWMLIQRGWDSREPAVVLAAASETAHVCRSEVVPGAGRQYSLVGLGWLCRAGMCAEHCAVSSGRLCGVVWSVSLWQGEI